MSLSKSLSVVMKSENMPGLPHSTKSLKGLVSEGSGICRAKRVVNNAMVNEVVSDAAVLKRQAKEIEELRKVLAANG